VKNCDAADVGGGGCGIGDGKGSVAGLLQQALREGAGDVISGLVGVWLWHLAAFDISNQCVVMVVARRGNHGAG
jgi:hypothetical protein